MTISLEGLNAEDVLLIGKCLKAAATGPFFPDWEFPTLFGLTREQMKAIAYGWPSNATDPDTGMAVRNTFSNLLGYPHRRESELELIASINQVEQVWQRLQSRRP